MTVFGAPLIKHPAVAFLWTALAAGFFSLAGCAKTHPTVKQPPSQPNPQPRVASDVTQRVHDLSREADNFAEDARHLPGGTTDEHLTIMRRIFTDLSQVLPLLENPQQNRQLAQRLALIQESRSQLSQGSHNLATEPTIDTGLRAAANALADISRTSYYEQADLGPLLDNLSAKINALDLSHGYVHQMDVTDVVDVMSQIVSKMANVLGQRTQEKNNAATTQATDGK